MGEKRIVKGLIFNIVPSNVSFFFFFYAKCAHLREVEDEKKIYIYIYIHVTNRIILHIARCYARWISSCKCHGIKVRRIMKMVLATGAPRVWCFEFTSGRASGIMKNPCSPLEKFNENF